MNQPYDIRTLFAQRLRELRKKKGLSVPRLAKLAKISRQHVRELELTDCKKFVTIRTLCKLALALDKPVWKLLTFKTRKCTW